MSGAAISIFIDRRDRRIKRPISDLPDQIWRLNLPRSASIIARCARSLSTSFISSRSFIRPAMFDLRLSSSLHYPTPTPTPSLFLTVDRPLGTIKIKDGGHNFCKENDEHSLAKITLAHRLISAKYQLRSFLRRWVLGQSPQPSTLLGLFSIARARPRQNLDRTESDWIADRGSRIADRGSRIADRITVWITDWTTDWITHRKKGSFEDENFESFIKS